MAGAMDLGEAFIALRVRSEEVKKDVEAGLTAADADTAGKTTGQKFARGFSGALGSLAKVGVAAYAGAALLAIKAGGDLETSQAKLDTAIKNTGQSAKNLEAPLDSARRRMEALGFSNAQTNTALASMTLATGSARTGIGLLATAANLAAVKGIDLQSATKLVDQAAGGANRALKQLNVTVASGTTWAKATTTAEADLKDQISAAGGAAGFASAHHLSLATAQRLSGLAASGSIPALNRLGIEVLPATATAAQRTAQFTGIMNQRIGGEAAAAAETSEGRFKVLQARFTDMGAAIGLRLMPPLLAVLGWLEHTGAIVPGVIGVFVLLGATMVAQAGIAVFSFGRMAVAGIAWAAEQTASVGETIAIWILYTGTVETAGVATVIATGGIILAVAALIAAAWLLYRNWGTVWGFIKRVVVDVFDWVKANWPLLLGILTGPIGAATILIIRNWRAIQAGGEAAVHAVAAAWDAAVRAIRGYAGELWLTISGVFADIIRGAADAFGWVPGLGGKLRTAAQAFGTFRNQVNDAITGINGKTVNVHVAFGGVSPGHKVIGEAASGGAITGPGGPTSDTAGLFALSNGEWVIRANSAARYGLSAMAAVNQGTAVIHYASGGPVGMASGGGVQIRPELASHDQIIKDLTAALQQTATAFARSQIAVGGGPVGGSSQNLLTIARFLMAHGATRAAAAGIAGTVAGESGGDPESVGSGGAGLIGWTPPGSAYPYLPLVTGNRARDFSIQLVDMLAYIQRNGGLGPLNRAGDPMDAAWLFSAMYERPLVTGSDIRSGSVASIYGQLGSGGSGFGLGGRIPEDVLGIGASGSGYLFHGGENVTPADGSPAPVDTGLEDQLEAIAGLLATLPAATGAALAKSMGDGGRLAGHRSYYGVAGG